MTREFNITRRSMRLPLNKNKYGLSYKENCNSCAVSDICSSYDNMMVYMKDTQVWFLICSPCRVEIKTDVLRHVLTDNHVKNVAKFSEPKRFSSHLLKFKYCSDCFSFCLRTFNNLTKHFISMAK